MPDEEVMGMTQGIYTSAITPRFLIRKVLSVRTADDVKYLMRGVKYMWGHLTDFAKDQVKSK